MVKKRLDTLKLDRMAPKESTSSGKLNQLREAEPTAETLQRRTGSTLIKSADASTGLTKHPRDGGFAFIEKDLSSYFTDDWGIYLAFRPGRIETSASKSFTLFRWGPSDKYIEVSIHYISGQYTIRGTLKATETGGGSSAIFETFSYYFASGDPYNIAYPDSDTTYIFGLEKSSGVVSLVSYKNDGTRIAHTSEDLGSNGETIAFGSNPDIGASFLGYPDKTAEPEGVQPILVSALITDRYVGSSSASDEVKEVVKSLLQ